MKTLLRCAFVAALALGLAAPANAGDLKLTIENGRVTLIAQDVPLRQILQEWARIGNTKIVNADKVVGAPITLELINVPERQALDTVLRSTAGYLAAPRPVGVMGASVYDRIMILPTSRPPAAVASAAPPAFQPRQQPPMEPAEDEDDPVNMPFASPNMPPNGTPNVAPVPGQAPPMHPNGEPGTVPPPVLTSPKPGALPQPATPNGVPYPQQPNGSPNPNQPSVIRPTPGGPGGPGGPGLEGNDTTR
jgi:hypothetical protein